MDIFVQHNSEIYGPFSREQICDCLQKGIFFEHEIACTSDNPEGRALKVLLSETVQNPASELVVTPRDAESTELKVFVQHEDDTVGPFSGEQVIAYMREGIFSENDLGCTEWNLEGRPLGELLMEAGLTSPSSKKISSALELSMAEPSLLDLQMRRASARLQQFAQEQPIDSYRKAPILIIAAAIAFLASGATAFFLFKPTSFKPPTVATNPSLPIAPNPTARVPQGLISEIGKTQESTAITDTSTAVVSSATTSTENDVAMLQDSNAQASESGVSQDRKSHENPTAVEDPPQGTHASAATATRTPRPVLVAGQRIVFPIGKDIPRGDLWYAQTTNDPKAVLLLCLPPNGGADNAVKSEAWQNFAKDNSFTLAAISFGSDHDMSKAAPGDSHPGVAVENLLINGLQSTFGNIPLILYGHGAGGTFAATFANWHPEKVKAWGAYASDWPLVTRPDKIRPPGVLACDNEVIKRGKTTVHDYFVAGRAQDKPWIFVPMAGAQDARQKSFEAFFCNYVKEIYTPNVNPKGAWVGQESRKLYSVVDQMRDPHGASWLPDASLIDSWISLVSDETGDVGKPIILQKEVATLNPDRSRLKLYLRLPAGAKSGRDVNGVLAFCTWNDDEKEILGILGIEQNEKLAGHLPALIRFAELNRMAVLAWGATHASLNLAVNNEDMNAREQRQSDSGFDAIAAAWEKGVSQFAAETGIPRNDYLLYGISQGAQFAHRLALREPDYFLAVHIHIPSSYDKPTPSANGVMWLLTTGEMDYGYKGGMQFYKECRGLGYPMIFKAIMGLGHGDDKIADDLGIGFFQYALSVRGLRDEHEAQKRLHMTVGQQTEGTWLQPFRDPEFFGDFLNQDCYPSGQESMIPDTLRVPLPTKALADAWNESP